MTRESESPGEVQFNVGHFAPMRVCTYCGRENEDAAIQCRECGTDMQSSQYPQIHASPKLKSLLRQPAYLAWLAAGLVFLHAFFRLVATPYDPGLGEGDVDRLDAAFYLYKSVGVATVLVALGLYLGSRQKGQHVA